MKRNISKKLSFKIFLPIGMITAIMLLLSVTISFYLVGQMESIFSKNISFAVKSNTEKVSSLLGRIDIAQRVISDGNERYFYGFTNFSDNVIENTSAYNNYKQNIGTTLQSLLTDDFPYYTAILFTDDSLAFSHFLPSSGNDIYKNQSTMFSNQFLVYNSDGIKHSQWYKAMAENNTDEYWFYDGNGRLCLAKTIGYFENSTFVSEEYIRIGTLLFTFDAQYLLNVANLSEFSRDTSIILYFGERAVYSNNESYINTSLADFSDSSQSNLYSDILSNGMRLVTVIPKTYTSQFPAIRIIFVTLLVLTCLLLAAAVYIYITKNVASPISKLSSHLSKQALTPVTDARNSEDEISTLYTSFNSMTQHIQSLVDKLYTSELEQQRSYQKMLQAQINPHFVYNILDHICCLSLLRGNEDIASVISNLSALMRYSIKDPDALVPISEELRIIDVFYQIQKFRYKDRITFEVNFPDADLLGSIEIPKLIIQPLVENAFYHGTRLCDEPLFVKLSISRKDNLLTVSVEDSIPNVDTERINDHLSRKTTISSSGGGFGIRNVQERIQLTYSSEYSLHYSPSSLGGVSAVFSIPIDVPVSTDIYLSHTKKYYEQLRGETQK